jgi:hypothetical protein
LSCSWERAKREERRAEAEEWASLRPGGVCGPVLLPTCACTRIRRVRHHARRPTWPICLHSHPTGATGAPACGPRLKRRDIVSAGYNRRDIVSAGYNISFSCPPDNKVAYFCNNLQTMPSSEIAEKKCNIKKKFAFPRSFSYLSSHWHFSAGEDSLRPGAHNWREHEEMIAEFVMFRYTYKIPEQIIKK